MSEPTTEAGKLLRSGFPKTGGPFLVNLNAVRMTEGILAIEAEAIKAERIRIAEAVRDMDLETNDVVFVRTSPDNTGPLVKYVAQEAVRRIIWDESAVVVEE